MLKLWPEVCHLTKKERYIYRGDREREQRDSNIENKCEI
jgi:hypothetical protein